jgi:hypothetical protein
VLFVPSAQFLSCFIYSHFVSLLFNYVNWLPEQCFYEADQVSSQTAMCVACVQEQRGWNVDQGTQSLLTEVFVGLFSPSREIP